MTPRWRPFALVWVDAPAEGCGEEREDVGAPGDLGRGRLSGAVPGRGLDPQEPSPRGIAPEPLNRPLPSADLPLTGRVDSLGQWSCWV